MRTSILITLVLSSCLSVARENPGKSKTGNASAKMAANCAPAIATAELDINNVRTTVLAGGDVWWDFINPKYEIPAGSGKHSMFAGSLWIGGIDGGGVIKVAAQTYRQTGNDFWSGALDTTIVNIASNRCQDYDRHWKVSRQNVLDFINTGATTPDIISWPGNGNATYNESQYLAPYYDNNGDGIYNHLDGDYPYYNFSGIYPTFGGTSYEFCDNYLFGDQNIWWVINDVGNVHTETGSDPIGLEIRCQAFALQASSPAINNSTFYKYQMINRSSTILTETYFGQWADPDLGNYLDDYVGCDAVRGLGYCYNGDSDDETAAGYGLNPPAIGIDFLKGPYADFGDMIDNDKDGCLDCTFIDSAGTTLVINDVVLPEGIAMSKFVYYNNINGSPVGNPNGFQDFYNYLRGIWLDNQPITYGGDGRNGSNPICNYMFPGTTDPNFATNWTEGVSGNTPGDRRFLQSAGPFTLMPGAIHYITTGVIWARASSGGPLASVALLQQHDDEVQQLFSNCFRVGPVGLNDPVDELMFSVFPNPSNGIVNFQPKDPSGHYEIRIFNSDGKLVMQHRISSTENLQWETEHISKGVYWYQIVSDGRSTKSDKLVVF